MDATHSIAFPDRQNLTDLGDRIGQRLVAKHAKLFGTPMTSFTETIDGEEVTAKTRLLEVKMPFIDWHNDDLLSEAAIPLADTIADEFRAMQKTPSYTGLTIHLLKPVVALGYAEDARGVPLIHFVSLIGTSRRAATT